MITIIHIYCSWHSPQCMITSIIIFTIINSCHYMNHYFHLLILQEPSPRGIGPGNTSQFAGKSPGGAGRGCRRILGDEHDRKIMKP